MNLAQGKLSKAEWESIEIPVSQNELTIIDLIHRGYDDVNTKFNNTKSLQSITKISQQDTSVDSYLYEKYFKSQLESHRKKYGHSYKPKINSKMKPKRADMIRIDNTDKIVNESRDTIYEFIVLELVYKLQKNYEKGKARWQNYYYTLYHMTRLNIDLKNSIIDAYCGHVLSSISIHMLDFLKNASSMIEENDYLDKFRDVELYSHQKQLFTVAKRPDAKLILYVAPTGTGKTLSPIGLASKRRVIFVCAARHVGLGLAKAAISAKKKIALAFNCKDAEGIRLHYYAAKEFTKHRKTGGIFRVDNTVGDKVEIMITDIKSYLYAMYYMIAFNKKEDIITYWDEPTITMDYENHPFHEIINTNWRENVIPNIVLSSATLPAQDEIYPTLADFKTRFGGEVYPIISHDCNKSIPIITKDCNVYLPHYAFDSYSDVMECVEHCLQHKTLLRYLSLREIVEFVAYVNDHDMVKKTRFKCEHYFESIDMITMKDIKMYYLEVLGALKEEAWPQIIANFKMKKAHQSNIKFITQDAHTLTNGPTIYLVEDIDKIARFCIQQAAIPAKMMEIMKEGLIHNAKINKDIDRYNENMETIIAKHEDNVESAQRDPMVKRIREKIEDLKQKIQQINLNDVYIPNRRAHIQKWANEDICKDAFTCDIGEDDVAKILLLNNIDERWKVLLLMGIGVFVEHDSIEYTEIMKRLADEKKLFMIIASSDYIYGTNYQFYHAYIGKDLSSMTQEKTIQAMGRVGRNNIHQTYSIRFRDDDLIKKLFVKEEDCIEIANMNRLFSSDVVVQQGNQAV